VCCPTGASEAQQMVEPQMSERLQGILQVFGRIDSPDREFAFDALEDGVTGFDECQFLL